jgi:HD-GYP domain-containing protein (c-di-GMP phosphodiesterase class II)
LAGLIHDIGKVRVPAEILTHPDGLSEAEFTMIKMHPVLGYEILKTMDLPWPIAQIVHQHHERMDGSGYPSGLSEEDIILEARILAVADVVEAMASHRPYRSALGINKALDEILHKRGRLYDARVVDACSKLFRELRFEFE